MTTIILRCDLTMLIWDWFLGNRERLLDAALEEGKKARTVPSKLEALPAMMRNKYFFFLLTALFILILAQAARTQIHDLLLLQCLS